MQISAAAACEAGSDANDPNDHDGDGDGDDDRDGSNNRELSLMTLTALALVTVAALMHVGWNALTKRSKNQFAFLWLSMSMASVLLAIPAAVRVSQTGFDTTALPFVAATSILHALYIWSLSRAYRAGDLSQVYPVARGSGVALVGICAWPVLGERPSVAGALALGVVVLGIIGVTRSSDRHTAPQRAAVSWAALTGVFITGYSLVDKVGAGHLDPLPYVVLLGAGACLWLAPLALGNREILVIEWRASSRVIMIAAFFTLTGYMLVLHAMQLANTAYVVASRELSIVFSVVIGRLWLGESPTRLRVIGAATIVAGVLALSLVR